MTRFHSCSVRASPGDGYRRVWKLGVFRVTDGCAEGARECPEILFGSYVTASRTRFYGTRFAYRCTDPSNQNRTGGPGDAWGWRGGGAAGVGGLRGARRRSRRGGWTP